MPIYEYRCSKCSKRFSMLTLRASEKVRPECTHCGGHQAQRLVSRFAMPKSDETRLASAADPSSMGEIDETDPSSVTRWMRKMAKEVGEDVSGEDFDQMVDEIDGGDEADD